MEVLPNIYQFKIPIPQNPLGFVNSYLVKTAEGCLLIDTGWNTDEAFEALTRQLSEVDVALDDLKYIVITHIHPDHYGLVGRLAKHTQAKLVIHAIERSLLDSRYVNYESLLEEMNSWLEINGVPTSVRPGLQLASMGMLGLVEVAMPDQVVHGGEHLILGDLDLEVIWTPGHSPGHISLYDRARRVLFSGDHILPKITPNVSMNSQTISNPLVDYLNALDEIAKLPVDMVMPGHGAPFGDLPARLEAIQQHHENRLVELLTICHGGEKTAYEIAVAATWYVPWEELPLFSRRMAVTETLSHLELLLARRSLHKALRNGIVWYSVAPRLTSDEAVS